MTGRCSKIAVGCAVSLHLAFAAALAARADGTIDFEASVPDTLFQQAYCGACGRASSVLPPSRVELG